MNHNRRVYCSFLCLSCMVFSVNFVGGGVDLWRLHADACFVPTLHTVGWVGNRIRFVGWSLCIRLWRTSSQWFHIHKLTRKVPQITQFFREAPRDYLSYFQKFPGGGESMWAGLAHSSPLLPSPPVTIAFCNSTDCFSFQIAGLSFVLSNFISSSLVYLEHH